MAYDQLAAFIARKKEITPSWSFYERIIKGQENWKLVSKQKLLPRRGEVYHVPAGHTLRFVGD